MRYSSVFALDTNTTVVESSRISIASAVRGKFTQSERGVEVDIQLQGAYELHNAVGDPERLAWRLFLQELVNTPGYRPSMRIGVVVDSSLDALSRISRRQEAIHDEYYIPDGIELIFSSDAARDSV
jgi:hypothetical protein